MTTGFMLVTIGLLLILIPVVNLYRTTFTLQHEEEKWKFLAIAMGYVWLAVMSVILGIAMLIDKT